MACNHDDRLKRLRRTWAWLAILGLTAIASANPRVDHSAPRFDEQPAGWLTHPTPELDSALVSQFALRGISASTFSPQALDLLEREFDRFAPILVRAQEPPNPVHPTLQRWYRERADSGQREAMNRAVRAWIVSDAIPPRVYENFAGSAERHRMVAVETLGDAHDRAAIPLLRGLRGRPDVDQRVLEASLLRIEDPKHADPFVADAKGRLVAHRTFADLDSMVIVAFDGLTEETYSLRMDESGGKRLWSAIEKGRVVEYRPSGISPREGPGFSGSLILSFRDGREIEFRKTSPGGRSTSTDWGCADRGRLDGGFVVANHALDEALARELARARNDGPRFVAETVTLWIGRNEMRVVGNYRFEGRAADGFLPLLYPFPEDSTLGPPQLLHASLSGEPGSGLQKVDAEVGALPWRFGLHPKSAASYGLNVEYTQPLAGRSATYVLRSTLDWGRPLRNATFEVFVDSSLGNPRFKLPFVRQDDVDERRHFTYSASPFFPDRDLVVRW